eukprot:3970166-Lingulodinium_polyedra.AAC.1
MRHARDAASASGTGLRVARRTSQTRGRCAAGVSSGGERTGRRLRASGSPQAKLLARLACGAVVHASAGTF